VRISTQTSTHTNGTDRSTHVDRLCPAWAGHTIIHRKCITAAARTKANVNKGSATRLRTRGVILIDVCRVDVPLKHRSVVIDVINDDV